MSLTLAASGEAAPHVVWDRYLFPSEWPSWAPHITSVEYPHRELSPGADGVVHGPVGVALDFRVLAVDRATRTWSWRVGVGRLGVRLDHTVHGVGPGTRTTLVVHAPRALALPYAPLASWALRRLVRP